LCCEISYRYSKAQPLGGQQDIDNDNDITDNDTADWMIMASHRKSWKKVHHFTISELQK